MQRSAAVGVAGAYVHAVFRQYLHARTLERMRSALAQGMACIILPHHAGALLRHQAL